MYAIRSYYVAFANADARLPGLAGGPLFLAAVRPALFVPMHAFGKPQDIRRESKRLTIPESVTFFYDAPGVDESPALFTRRCNRTDGRSDLRRIIGINHDSCIANNLGQ